MNNREQELKAFMKMVEGRNGLLLSPVTYQTAAQFKRVFLLYIFMWPLHYGKGLEYQVHYWEYGKANRN